MTTTPAPATIYTEVTGCTCYLDGERGTMVGMKHGIGHHLDGVFVLMNEGGMRYVEVGAKVAACNCGRPSLNREGHHEHCNVPRDRKTSHEVRSHREIDRDEFDRLNGIDALRAELGWV